MSKVLLEIEENYDFDLIGICCHIKDYRMVWELNQQLGLDLCKDSNFDLHYKKHKQSHPFHHFCDDENLTDYFLIGNRSENGLLIPEENKCDYLLVIKGQRLSAAGKIAFLKQINAIKHVLTAYEIEVEELKSKANLIF